MSKFTPDLPSRGTYSQALRVTPGDLLQLRRRRGAAGGPRQPRHLPHLCRKPPGGLGEGAAGATNGEASSDWPRLRSRLRVPAANSTPIPASTPPARPGSSLTTRSGPEPSPEPTWATVSTAIPVPDLGAGPPAPKVASNPQLGPHVLLEQYSTLGSGLGGPSPHECGAGRPAPHRRVVPRSATSASAMEKWLHVLARNTIFFPSC